MQLKAKVMSGMLGLLLLFSINRASAQDYPPMFDAVFQMNIGISKESRNVHIISDGKGHMRNEIVGTELHDITDFQDHISYWVNTSEKTATKITDDPQVKQMAFDETSAQKIGAVPIGTKTIDGHPCHGWKYVSQRNTTEMWIGDDIHYLVESIKTADYGNSTMHLISLSRTMPDPALFQVPSDYRIVTPKL